MSLRTYLTLLLLTSSSYINAFTLRGDGKWYRSARMSGRHAYFEYIYSHGTPNNPSISSGELTFINSRNTLIQHHQTMGYQAWNQLQFALINFGNYSEVWVKATPGVSAGEFEIRYNYGGSINGGDINDTDLTDNGGTLTLYDKLNDDSNIFYQNLKVPAGDVTIGTNDPHGAKLAVNGTIRAQEIKVEAGPWPDHVFSPEYNPPTLQQLDRFIQKNKHLPGVPSAAEVDKNGLALGEVVRIQMQKIEELTQYLIEKDKEVRTLKVRIEKLEGKPHKAKKVSGKQQ